MLKFHDDNENDHENANEILLSFSLRFVHKEMNDSSLPVSSSTTTITHRNPVRTQEMMMSAHKNIVFVLVVVVKS